MAESKKPDHAPAHQSFDVTKPEGRFFWFFYEFWPIIVPGTLFLLMCALPLTLSYMMHSPFSSADAVWPGYGLLLIAEFIVAVLIVCFAPQFLAPYMLILAIYSLIFAENFNAWKVGFVSDGRHTWMVNNGSILFLTYMLVGNFVVWRANISEKKRSG